MFVQYIDSPLGLVKICATAQGISAIVFVDKAQNDAAPSSLTRQAATQLQAYFAGTLTRFSLPLSAQGTPFQHLVWRELCNINFADTCSYADIARQIAKPKAVRAVGGANSRNPLAIVVPCHRVIGANGSLTGYAGGMTKKAWLLQHEQRQMALFNQAVT